MQQDDRRWWPIMVSVGSSVVSAGLAIALCLSVSARNAERGKEARRQERQVICTLIVASDDNYRATPPTTDLGKAQARSYAALRVSQGCPSPPSN